ncbi:hypothetical protein F5884DRAFT_205184 [Xylogone sp. PMI_703]|nr:hypothetical protein F5884DRAFT_205184 [Xylogone sp. PMI_703]
MGCTGRVKASEIRAEQKWDFISLNDFKSTSCFTPFAYAYLWVSLAISIAVYAVDTFTAVNLLAFDRWSGDIKPYALNVSKWIFSACIIASWVNLGFEWLRAIRVMRRGSVVESYLDSLAVRVQCIRLGQRGRGWKRFLVFAELTKSKKGVEYIALFTFFSFQAWIRIIFCAGPRQVVNAMTLYTVFKAQLDPTDANDVGSSLVGFFKNLAALAEENQQQTVILSGMTFTLVIWLTQALSLLLALILYLMFLWHYIPNADGGLTGYCERKVNERLGKIVSAKVNKALEEEERQRRKAEAKALKNGEKPLGPLSRQATLPVLFDSKSGDSLPAMPMLNRNDTTATLPQYTSRPASPGGQPTLPGLEMDRLEKKPFTRTNTGSSSYAPSASLLNNASDMGYGRSGSPTPSLPHLDTSGPMNGPQRSMTGNTNSSSPWQRGPPNRVLTGGLDRGFTQSPMSYSNDRGQPGMSPMNGNGPYRGPTRQNTFDSYGRPMDGQSPVQGGPSSINPRDNRPLPPAVSELSGRSITPGAQQSMSSRGPFDTTNPSARQTPAPGPGFDFERTSSPAPNQMGRASPGPNQMGSGPNRSFSPVPSNAPPSRYQPYQPNSNLRNVSSASPAPYPASPPQQSSQQYRNMTDPGSRPQPDGGDYFGNPAVPPPARTNTAQRRYTPPGLLDGPPARVASPAVPYNNSTGRQSPAPFGSPPRQGQLPPQRDYDPYRA